MTRRSAVGVLGAASLGVVLAQAKERSVQILTGDDLLGQESVRGHLSVPQAGAGYSARSVQRPSGDAGLCIVPAGKRLSQPLCEQLAAICWRGSVVLLEHPTSFSNDDKATYLGVSLQAIERPPDLYVELCWPKRCLVRRFGQLHSVTGGHAIAHSSSYCVGISKPFGKGRLICLSTVLGPQLLSGDTQAREWFASLISHVLPLSNL